VIIGFQFTVKKCRECFLGHSVSLQSVSFTCSTLRMDSTWPLYVVNWWTTYATDPRRRFIYVLSCVKWVK